MTVLFVRMECGVPRYIVGVESRVFEKTRHFAFHHLVGLLEVVAVPLTEFGLEHQQTVPDYAFRFA